MLILLILTTVLLALLAPHLEVLTTCSRWLLPGASALLACSFILFGALRSGYDTEYPKPDTISYWLDANTCKASWMSFDRNPDNWTSRFLSGHFEASTVHLFNPVDGDAILKAEAPYVQLPRPSIETLEDSVTSRERRVRLHLVSLRQARIIWIHVEKATVLAASVEDRNIQVNEADKRNKVWGLVYLVLPSEGIELDLTLNASETPQLTVIDQSDGFPSFSGFHFAPGPIDRMALPTVWPFFDSTLLVSHMFPNLPEKNSAQPVH
jgi:hypothetical protein